MASQGDPTRVGGGTPPPRPPAAAPAETGVDLTTLFLSAIASAAAAYITSKIWAPGTLFSAAMSPVIVALVKEGLRKPTEAVVNVVPAVATPSRWTRQSASDPGLVAEPDPAAPPEVHVDPDAPHVVLPPVAADTAPVRVYSTRGRRMRWRLALITGLLGFGIAVVVFTVPELIAGDSLGGSHKTTIFGGSSSAKKKTTTSTSTTKTTPTTATQTMTVTQTTTVTTPTTATTTPTTTTATPTTTTATPTTTTPPAAAQQAPAQTTP
jgi:hypothetical protein